MNRRHFLPAAAAGVGALWSGRISGAQMDGSGAGQTIRIKIDRTRNFGPVPADFLGLGYEISSVATTGLLSAKNRTYLQLVRTLGPSGVIRIGGNTSDYSSFAPNGPSVAAPKATVVSEQNLQDLGTFLDETGWKLIWGLNLGGGSEQEAALEAQSVFAAAGDKLLAFEIGNEPDLFGRGAGHRSKEYSYENYLSEYRRYKAAIRRKLPRAPFAGPDAASATGWVTRFADDEGRALKLLTHHYYRECTKPTSTLDELLNPDPKLTPELKALKAASEASGVPYRICETNSFCGGGKPGVSDTFGSALWALDYMFTLLSGGASGVNMETGVNQLGFVSSYSPIGDDEHGAYSARPEYYGMLAFAQAIHGHRIALDYEAAGVNLTAYAVASPDKQILVTLINKDPSRNADVVIACEEHLVQAQALRLAGPSLVSKGEVTLGGSTVTAQGDWKPERIERLTTVDRECRIHVPAASAAIVELSLA